MSTELSPIEGFPATLLESDGNIEYDPAEHEVPVPEITETVSPETEISPEPEPESLPKSAPVSLPVTQVVEVPVPETTEVVESSRVSKPAPSHKLPLDVARALGMAPEGTTTNAHPATTTADAPGGSIFWDDDDYFTATVQAGNVEIRLRELSEETLQFVASFNTRVEEATEKRVSAELAAHLFDGFKNAPPKIMEQALAVSTEDAVLIKEMLSAMRDKVLCEGIVSWEPQARPCTGENKLKLGRAIRDKCLVQIFKISTFGENGQDFLEGSPSPSSPEKTWTSSPARGTH